MDLEIRRPTADDAEAVGRMHYASWQEAYTPLLQSGFFSPEQEAGWIERWRRNLAEPDGTVEVRVAARGDEIVGLVTVGPSRPNPSTGVPVRATELWSIYVRASEYGTGLADRLLAEVLPDDVPAQVWVFEHNPRARAFYEKHGFRADGGNHVFGPEYNKQPEIRMVR